MAVKAVLRELWTKEIQKLGLKSRPFLHLSDIDSRFVFRTDASDQCLGAVLMQRNLDKLIPVASSSSGTLSETYIGNHVPPLIPILSYKVVIATLAYYLGFKFFCKSNSLSTSTAFAFNLFTFQ
ncbi:hypothetical protein PoB_005792900 [Plakobranchus ocellatus]|uniref:Reverse transcriptase/retrotransposon-derived protein RNase H-like domain-containing protein n=1 Tax=Plakobranchus ocellatus TaxID=259542 RepID=A0AAV4CKI3_9GAST|nr:hypothetical protein PoB_005792900 [Plakobranchus ocellatus]